MLRINGWYNSLQGNPQHRKASAMSFLRKIFGSPSSQGDKNAYSVHVRCKRCGEEISARINLSNDLSAEYDGERTSYVCRKILMGEGRCFQQIEVVLKFDQNRRMVDRTISGGEFIE
jgi:hypothetical protein